MTNEELLQKLSEQLGSNNELVSQLLGKINALEKKVDETTAQLRDVTQQQEMFTAHINQIYAAKSIEETLGIMSDLGRNEMNAESCDVYSVDAFDDKIFTVNEYGERVYADIPENSPISAALLKNEIYIDNNYAGGQIGDGRDNMNTKNIAVIPIESKNGDVIGVVVAKNKDKDFDKSDVDKFNLKNGKIGSAFRMGLENKALKQAAVTDKLTHLPNRQGAAEFLSASVLPQLQQGKDTAVIMCDIDHFKSVNDTYGHDAGDRVLQHIAKTISQNLRTGDKVYRWGGEEMVVVMNNANTTIAANLAERLRAAIEKSPCVIDDERTINVTMSMGVEKIKVSDISALNKSNIFEFFEKNALKNADERLYEAKETGRNKVVVNTDDIVEEKRAELRAAEFENNEKSAPKSYREHTDRTKEINAELITEARNADLANYFISSGYEYEKNRNEVHIKGFGGLNINTEKNSWYHFSERRGGSNPINCLTEVIGMDFKEAVKELTGQTFERAAYQKPAVSESEKSSKDFSLPERDNNCKKIYAYFISTRHIDKSVIDEMVKSRSLYQDKKGNAVFVRRDENGNAIGAEVHGTNTYKRYKGIVGEGDNAFSFKIGKPEKVYVFESAVDLMSFKEIANPEKINNSVLISMGGLKAAAFEQYREQGIPIFACVDNDIAGEKFISDNNLKSCNKVLKENGVKDWNELIQKKKGVMKLPDEEIGHGGKEKTAMEIANEAKSLTDNIVDKKVRR